ncbi:MAG: radical SAM protein [Phyllobacteriaceae bacterium]|nr:radical SAM protein [Phyllobacteriaceae bacterium]
MNAPAPSLYLGATESVCPVCLRTLPAERIGEDDTVFLCRTCPDHGTFRVPVWRGLDSWFAWGRGTRAHSRPPRPTTAVKHGCPQDCGLCPDHRQQSCCVLLEVTSRCDLACPICFASAGRKGSDASLAEIDGWLDTLAEAGGHVHVQLSGGEPTVRDDLPEIVARIRAKGFEFVQLNTNGIRIALEPDYLGALVDAGLDCVFLQFDGVADEVHRAIRGARLARLKATAIERCRDAGIGVVLVPTIVPGVNAGDVGAIVDFAIAHMPTVRAVHFQPVSWFGRHPGAAGDVHDGPTHVTLPEVVEALIAHADGTIGLSDFRPGSAENPYCSFSGRFRVDDAGRLHPHGGAASCCGAPPEATGTAASDCCGSTRPSADVARARRYVAGQWRMAADPTATGELDAFDRFLAEQDRVLGLSGMAFQDAWTLDLDRLRQCHVHVVSPDRRVVPFCAWNLTDAAGLPLHRPAPITAKAAE